LAKGSNSKRRKPRGVTEAFHLTSGADPEFIRTHLPDDKAEIEKTVLARTLEAAVAQKVKLYELAGDPVQNEENDFDFSLPTADGLEYLDLVEYVASGGYAKSAASYRVGDMVDRMFDLVRMKARKYGENRKSVTHLLMYSTHWKFLPSETVIELMRHLCATRKHGFKTVAVVAPTIGDSVAVWKCFPMDDGKSLTALRESAIRRSVVHQFDPRAARAMADGSVSWEIPKVGE
jgi:hypothetical protein